MKTSKALRRRFFAELWRGVVIVWPVLSGLLVFMAALGLVVGRLEGWPATDGLYFAFVTGLTVGYGDLVPKLPGSRVLAISIGLSGIVLTGLFVAVCVQALQVALGSERGA